MIKRAINIIPNYTARLKNELQRQYYLYDGEFEHGPYTLDELRSKRLSAKSLIWHSRLKEWVTVAEVAEVAALVNDTQPQQRETDDRHSQRENSTFDYKRPPRTGVVTEPKKTSHKSLYVSTGLVIAVGIIIWMVFTTC